jgi:hypothetical protein
VAKPVGNKNSQFDKAVAKYYVLAIGLCARRIVVKMGCARVLTRDQDAASQIDALKKAGCERISKEKASGGRWDMPETHHLLEQLRKGEVLVVWKLDRLSRTLKNVLTRSSGLWPQGRKRQRTPPGCSTSIRLPCRVYRNEAADIRQAIQQKRSRNKWQLQK